MSKFKGQYAIDAWHKEHYLLGRPEHDRRQAPRRPVQPDDGDKNPNLNLFLEEKQVFPLRKSSAFGLVRKGEINFDKI